MSEPKSLEQLEFTTKLMKLPRLGWRYALEHCEEPKMTKTMINICMVISMEKGISQDGVSKALRMDKSSVAKIVMKAVRSGFIIRTINKDDLREYRLELSEEGQQYVNQFTAFLEKWQSMVMKNLSDTERAEFQRLGGIVYETAVSLDDNK